MSPVQHRILGIHLSEGVAPRHLFAYFFVALVSSGFAGLLAILEPGLWQIMGIAQDKQGAYTGNLRMLQEVYYILFMGLFGALSDRHGRRIIYAIGLATISIGILLYPYSENTTDLVFYRSLIGLGGAAMMAMLVAVIADYTRDETRGRANGIQGFMVVLGAMLPIVMGILPKVFVNSGMDETEAFRMTFAASAALGMVAATTAWLGLSAQQQNPSKNTEESLIRQVIGGIKAARLDGRIALSYGAAFISRGDLAITGAFMGLWVGQIARYQMNLDTSEATLMVTYRVMTTVSGALFGTVVMGFLFDRMSRVSAVMLASGLAAVVYFATGLVQDPTETWVFGLLFLMGIAEISAFVSSQVLVGEYAPVERRGAIIGVFGTAGAIGILIGSGVGGLLFDAVGPGSPFLLFGVLNGLVFLWAVWVRRRYSN